MKNSDDLKELKKILFDLRLKIEYARMGNDKEKLDELSYEVEKVKSKIGDLLSEEIKEKKGNTKW